VLLFGNEKKIDIFTAQYSPVEAFGGTVLAKAETGITQMTQLVGILHAPKLRSLCRQVPPQPWELFLANLGYDINKSICSNKLIPSFDVSISSGVFFLNKSIVRFSRRSKNTKPSPT
jgi:hypothetical protein